jgi:predicted RND superfamily exporter protein
MSNLIKFIKKYYVVILFIIIAGLLAYWLKDVIWSLIALAFGGAGQFAKNKTEKTENLKKRFKDDTEVTASDSDIINRAKSKRRKT